MPKQRKTSKSNYPELNIPKAVVIYELITGVFETISGFSLALLGNKLLSTYENLRRVELLEDSHDTIAYLAEKFVPNLFEHRIYIALTLIAIGVTKIVSGIGISYHQWWADHLLVVLVLAFIVINSLESLATFSVLKFIFLIVNVIIFLYLVEFQPLKYLSKLLKNL